ncbi:hypothetical protein HW532_17400 [Kaustia mangrovi]|uniref:Uncharacterized protein n=1 Tax=Kaustia mangrovi TaxID=2593653 RepID=A0A7S8C6N4_9HYPH|nr:hypothetical protein [Kaustia mangrovi]QPC44317.1 hypothetical protein HW532_17400 [Kaustia mangrovi]
MSMSFTLIAPQAERQATGIDGLQDRLVDTLRQQEQSIIGDIDSAVDLSSPLMSLPEPVREQFRRWANDPQYQTPEQARLLQVTKNKIIELYSDNRDYIRNKVDSNADKIRLELSIKAVGKTISSVQQLLSSQ